MFYALPLASCCAAVPSADVLPMCELYVSCARLRATLLAMPMFWHGDCQGVHPAQRAAVVMILTTFQPQSIYYVCYDVINIVSGSGTGFGMHVRRHFVGV